MTLIDIYAAWIGRIVLIGVGGVAVILGLVVILWVLNGLARVVWLRLKKVYNIGSMIYWLQQLDATGRYAIRKEIESEPVRLPALLGVDWQHLAVDLETEAVQATPDSARRAMLAAAQGLRQMGTPTGHG